MTGQYKAQLIKNGQIQKQIFNVVSCQSDKKYGYFSITQMIFKHQIITIHRFAYVDSVILIDKDGNRKEIHQ